MKITVIDGMNLDLLGVPESKLLLRDSNPGRILLRPGGVGRNIASRLRSMGADVRLITALGADEHSALLENLCRGEGIDLSLSLRTELSCPTYLCVHDEKGDMAVGVNDMAAIERLTPAVIEPLLPAVNASDACVVDANLSAETLDFIGQNASVPLIADPVSAIKAQRLRGTLPYLTALKPNQLEAAALTGEIRPEKSADILLRMGVRNVFISLGAEGVYYAGKEERGVVPALPLPVVPQTGAGDALCAGLTIALLQGKSPRECARAGCGAAHDALMAARGV